MDNDAAREPRLAALAGLTDDDRFIDDCISQADLWTRDRYQGFIIMAEFPPRSLFFLQSCARLNLQTMP